MKTVRAALGVWLGVMGFAFGAAEPGPSPPLPPKLVSPVAVFRELLAMPAEERPAVLAARFPRQEAELRSRLAVYERLTMEDREERLRATDLYWHMQQLLRRGPDERIPLLDGAPSDLRPILVQRLQVWDSLPDADREALLQQEQTIRYFARLRASGTPPLPPGHGLAAGPAVSLRAQAEFERQAGGSAVGEARRAELWRRLFESPPRQTETILRGMDEGERREMDAALGRFRELTPAQRQVCIESFGRLAVMPATERAEFLRRAERWESLPPEERAAWRRLVPRLPPLPPAPDLSSRPPDPLSATRPVPAG